MGLVDISALERFVLWSLRIGLTPADPSMTYRLLHRAFHSLRVGDALPYFLRFTTHVTRMWHSVQHVPDIHCTCCSNIGDDEWRLLQTIAALQMRDVGLAMRHLDALLPAGGSRGALPAAMHVAAILSDAGWVLESTARQAANAPVLAFANTTRH